MLWNKKEDNKKIRINNSKKTLLDKYGVDSIFKTDNFKENYKQIFEKKYGVSTPMHHEKFVNKLKKTVKDKHLINLIPKLHQHNISLLDEYVVNKSGNTSLSYSFKCDVCENVFSSTLLGSGIVPICRKCYAITKNSKLE